MHGRKCIHPLAMLPTSFLLATGKVHMHVYGKTARRRARVNALQATRKTPEFT